MSHASFPVVLTDSLKTLFKDTATRLKGTERRQFMAQVVQSLGRGRAAQVERELGWHRGTIRKGQHELKHGPGRRCVRGTGTETGGRPTAAIAERHSRHCRAPHTDRPDAEEPTVVHALKCR